MIRDDETEYPIKGVHAYKAGTILTNVLPWPPSEELDEPKVDYLTAHLDKNKLTLEGMFPKKMPVNAADSQIAYISNYLSGLTDQPLDGAVYD
jgi:hypothetical protein